MKILNFKKTLEELEKLELTQIEKLQIFNELPETELNLMLIIKNCEERFKNVEIQNIIRLIKTLKKK